MQSDSVPTSSSYSATSTYDGSTALITTTTTVDVADFPAELHELVFRGFLVVNCAAKRREFLKLRLVSSRWRKLLSRLPSTILFISKTAGDIQTFAAMFPGCVSLNLTSQQESYGAELRSFYRLQGLSLHMKDTPSPTVTLDLPSSLTSLVVMNDPSDRRSLSIVNHSQLQQLRLVLSCGTTFATPLPSALTSFEHFGSLPETQLRQLITNSSNLVSFKLRHCKASLPFVQHIVSTCTALNKLAVDSVTDDTLPLICTLTSLSWLAVPSVVENQIHQLFPLSRLTYLYGLSTYSEFASTSLAGLARNLPDLRRIEGKQFEDLHTALAFKNLEHFELRRGDSLKGDAVAICHSLIQLTRLQSAVFRILSSDALIPTIQALSTLPNFSTLQLHHCLKMFEGYQCVSLTNLTSLTFESCTIMQESLDAICAAVGTSLRYLRLRSEPVTTLRPIGCCTRLQTLVIQQCDTLENDSLRHITQLPALTTLAILEPKLDFLHLGTNAAFRFSLLDLSTLPQQMSLGQAEAVASFLNVAQAFLRPLSREAFEILLSKVHYEELSYRASSTPLVLALDTCVKKGAPILRTLRRLTVTLSEEDSPELLIKLTALRNLTNLDVFAALPHQTNAELALVKIQRNGLKITTNWNKHRR